MTASSPPTVSSSVYFFGFAFLIYFPIVFRLLLSLLLPLRHFLSAQCYCPVCVWATVFAKDQSCSDSLGLQIHIQSTL